MISSKYVPMTFYFVALAALTIPALYFHNLREQMASHFNASGIADGWMSKSSYVQTYYILLIAIIFLFMGINFSLKKFPDSIINIPNKKYWFDPSRKETALRTIKNFIYLMGILTIYFITLIFISVYRANINGTYSIGNSLWFYLIILITSTLFFVIKIYSYFNKTDNH